MTQSTITQRKKVLLLALLIVAFDQLVKYWMVANLEGKAGIPVLPVGASLEDAWIWFDVTRNTGAAFGIGAGLTYLFSVLAIFVIGVIFYMLKNFSNPIWLFPLALMMGGAAGNLLDRIFRDPGVFRGAVVDFISVKYFSVFNVADSFITISAILIIIFTIFKIDEKQS